MKTKQRFLRGVVAAGLAWVACAAELARAADGVWSGGSGAAWTNDANWSASPHPSGAETATFSGAGAGNTVIDLSGLTGILNVTFATAGVAGYTLGAGGANAQELRLEGGGLVQVGADAAQGQAVSAAVRLGPDAGAAAYRFRNDAAALTLAVTGSVSGAEGGAPGVKTLTLAGSGETRLHGAVSDGGAGALRLVSEASGTVTLAGANTHSGGTAVEAGTVVASHRLALGTGAVSNNGTLNLTVGQTTYSGLSNALSGAGTVNVKLGTGTGITYLDGDYSGFSGVWNLGAGSAAGRARMNGADAAAATVNVLSNASLYVSGAVVKHATAVLYGGDICDQAGQLRLEDGAEWAGPVVFAGNIADGNDGLVGNENGQFGTLSGPISDLNGPHSFEKRLTGTLALTATNSTYAGSTWCRGGSLIVTALKNLGEPSSLGAPLAAENNIIKLGSANTTASLVYTGAGDTTDRGIDLAGATGGAVLEHAGSGLLKLTGPLTFSGLGSKTLTLAGGTNGVGELCGSFTNSTGGTHTLAKSGSGTWVLSGVSTHGGETQIHGGTLKLAHPRALSGPGLTRFYSPLPGAALEFAHDGADEVPFNITVAIGSCGTLLSGRAADGAGLNHTVGTLNLSLVTVTVARASTVLSGSPSITAQTVNLSGGGPHTTTLYPTTADLLIGNVTLLSGAFRKTLRLDGTSNGSAVSGVIENGIHTVSLVKAGTNMWTLSGANTYTGTTAVASGLLALAGAAGAITASDSVSLSGNGTLLLDNSAAAHADRLGDACPVTLAGGSLAFGHAAGAADYSEAAGALTVAASSNRVAASRAAEGRASALTFAALARTGGVVDFAGEGLGQDARNQVRFTAEPALTDGIIGPWATVNGVLATYGAYGVTAFDSFAELSAKGPSVVPDNPAAHARISSEGTAGGITLEAAVTRVGTLTQSTAHPAAVSLTNATLRTAGVRISAGGAALTLGDAVGDGTLTALADGGELLLGSDSSAAITVNAAVADNGAPSSLTAAGPGSVVLRGALQHTGSTAVEGGELTFDSHELPQLVGSVITGGGAVVKSGTNLLHLLASNTHTGPMTIRAGVVRPDQNTAFGGASGGVTLEDGATLDVGCTPDVGGTRTRDSLNLGAEPFFVRGAGVDGRGVIVNNSTGAQYSVFGQITLTGAATFGGLSDWRLRYNSPLLALNDHTLTKAGTNYVDLYGVTVEPGAGHLDVAEGTLRLLYGTRMNGGSANTVTVRSGATLELHNFYPQYAPAWRMVCQSNATLRIGQGVGTTNAWAGPVELNGPLNLTAAGGYRMTLSGAVSGTGPVLKQNSSWVTFSGTNSTYDGMTRINNGRLVVSSLRNVGEPSSLGQPSTAENGAIAIGSGTTTGVGLVYVGAGDTTDRAITLSGTTGGANLYQEGTGLWKLTADLAVETAGNKGVAFRGDGSAPGEFAGRITNVGGNAINVTKYDSGTWVLSGMNAYSGSTTKYGASGTLMFTGSNTCSGSVVIYGGTLHIAGVNTFTGNQSVNGGELVFSGTNAQGSGYVYVGSGSGSNGVLRILDGAHATGTGAFHVGNGSGSAGAVYVTGGTLSRTPADGTSAFGFGRGQGSYGYLNVSGGSVFCTRLQVGGLDTSTAQGVGVVRQTGGFISFPKWLLLGRNVGSVGVLTLGGGELQHLVDGDKRNLTLCYEGGRGELNLTGGLLNSPGSYVSVRQNSSTYAATGLVNLCAGTLFVNGITNRGALAYVNFAGGTLKAASDETRFLPDFLSGVHVYGPFSGFPGGAVIDTDGKNVVVSAPLAAPPGSGVSAVVLSEPGSGYLGEPHVSIEGGGGLGATAVANMQDDGTGAGTLRVASVTVTCPGWGYTSAPEVVFVKGGNGAVAPTVGEVTLAANASGGLTKLGAGTLTLSAANTYGGGTTVAGGTLVLAHEQALPAQSPVALAGGALDLGGYTVARALSGDGTLLNGTLQASWSPGGEGALGTNVFAVAGGAVLRAVSYTADVTAEGACDRVTIEGAVDLSGAQLQLVDPDLLNRSHAYTLLRCTGARTGTLTAVNLPDSRWQVVYGGDGTVRLMFVDGTLIKIQ